ncbi:protein-methionine-sulfoxide reductase heme-binding subunit MsrQ [Dongia deserti]|uniref:sulfite oxidase heme-binding subunit YedZ n=1 Tax=Dongia deserti TaxID=2268030 RepID=UPI000E646C83|nr:protein-methionine-sulfoxide reductase heme-binding subunit MsrQ [Dongia deserti]
MAQAAARLSSYIPWLDRSGRVSTFKALVFALLLLPGVYVAWQLAIGGYARPYILANHDLGDWAIRLLFVTLAVTPFRQSLGLPKLILVRRMIGVAAFCYALAHFLFFALDKSLQFDVVAREIALRYYLAIGFVGLLILLALAATSTDGMVRRMGGKKWAALHRLVYAAGVLAVVHFFIQSKADVTEPFIMGGLYLWLMLWRLLARRGRLQGGIQSVVVLVLLAVVSAAAAAGAEAIYYYLKTGADLTRILATNWMTGIGLRPASVVGGAGLAVAVGAALQPLWSRRSGGRRQVAAA